VKRSRAHIHDKGKHTPQIPVLEFRETVTQVVFETNSVMRSRFNVQNNPGKFRQYSHIDIIKVQKF